MSLSCKLMAGIERKTGLSSAEIKSISPSQLRKYLAKRTKKAFSVTTEFPNIGRGNILRDGLANSSEINRITDKMIGEAKMKIDISKWTIEITSDLFNAGMSEDGEYYTAEMYFITATRKDGKCLAHNQRYHSARAVDNGDGCMFFVDNRKEILPIVEALCSRIKASGVIDDTYWTEIEPSYGSEYYCKVHNF